MRVNRVSYLHYVLLFALSLICVTVGVTLWTTYRQALIVYELSSARALERVAKTAEPYLSPRDVQELKPLSAEDWAKHTPTDPISQELARIAQRNDIPARDGGGLLLIKLPPVTPQEKTDEKAPRETLKAGDYPVLASSSGLKENWWLVSRQDLPEVEKLRAGETVLFKGRNGFFNGEQGMWSGVAVPLKMEGGPYVFLFSTRTNFHSDLSHFPFRDLVPVIVVVFLVVMALSIFFAGHIISAIWTALKALRKMAEGELDYRLSRRRQDEFGLLFRTVNNLADHLQLRDSEVRRGSRLLGEALNASGAPVAVCLSSGALLYASDSALAQLGISHSSLPVDGTGDMVSLPKRLIQADLTPFTLPTAESIPQDRPELEFSALWLPHEVAQPIAEAPSGTKAVKFSLIALNNHHQAKEEDSPPVEGYLLIFSHVENFAKPAEVAAVSE